MRSIEEIVVIGSGNWGLTLASLFAGGHPVRVWTIDEAIAENLNANRRQPGDFYKYPLPDSIVIEPKYATRLDENRTLIILAVPSSRVRAVAHELARHARTPLVLSVSKGFDVDGQCTMSQVIQQEIPGASVVVLTGPTIANEVAEGKPTRAVLACKDLTSLALVKQALRNDVISFEISRDPTHHEMFAALKGIVAIGIGMVEGLELGKNIQGLLMTQGLREMAVVASFFGIPGKEAFGISGAADLITTCISPDSRNRRLGAMLAHGLSMDDALREVGMTVEGVAMSRTIETLRTLDVSIPFIQLVNAVVLGKCQDVRRELVELMAVL